MLQCFSEGQGPFLFQQHHAGPSLFQVACAVFLVQVQDAALWDSVCLCCVAMLSVLEPHNFLACVWLDGVVHGPVPGCAGPCWCECSPLLQWAPTAMRITCHAICLLWRLQQLL